jgi:hypothetical protein
MRVKKKRLRQAPFHVESRTDDDFHRHPAGLDPAERIGHSVQPDSFLDSWVNGLRRSGSARKGRSRARALILTSSIWPFHTSTMRASTKKIQRLRTTVMLDPVLLAAAKHASGAHTNNAVIETGLRELERKAALRRLADNLGKADPGFEAAPRRRVV